jgi:hypothetical protein
MDNKEYLAIMNMLKLIIRGCILHPMYILFLLLLLLLLLLGVGATGWTAGVQFPARTRDFSLFCSVQTGTGAQAASYPKAAADSYHRDKAAGASS